MEPPEIWKANRGGLQGEVSSVEHVWAERSEEGIPGGLRTHQCRPARDHQGTACSQTGFATY